LRPSFGPLRLADAPPAAALVAMVRLEDDATLGFSRPEMCSEPLAGTAKAPFSRHICMAWGKAEEWPAEVPEGFPAGSLPTKVEATIKEVGKVSGEKVKVTYIEATGSIRDGDVLIFPDYVKISAKADGGLAALKSVLSKRRDPSVARCLEDVEDLDSGFLLVCSHTKRDERCGHCGPRLVEAFLTKGVANAANMQVLKCSHVGGHIYAGNVIAYSGRGTKEGDDGHWYGYVTPAEAALVASGSAARGRLWRGRMGLSEAGAKSEARMKRFWDVAPILVVVTAAAVVVAAIVVQKRKP